MPTASRAPVRYLIRPARPDAHLFEIQCLIENPDPAGHRLQLPAWIPGSYMIREFARNIVSIRAESAGKGIAVEKIDKHSWQTGKPVAGHSLQITYEVYAWDLSVRAAHLDATHGFFNGTSVFLAVEGRTEEACLVDIRRLEGAAYREWKVATALSPAQGLKGAAKTMGFGLYRAANYDELIDHPVEMGRFTLGGFDAAGVRHDVVLTGRHDCDLERLSADLQRICEWHNTLFGGTPPMDRYVFMTMIVGDGYGGLEHRASTALIASRKDLPYHGMKSAGDDYIGFLGLCSHEYFHTWNVKRIKPAAFVPYDLRCENYTGLLWAFEGFTSYYDDLALVRTGLIDPQAYLDLVGKTIANVLRAPGRFRQSVAESSFDAWIKYYRQDENAPNAIVSYYAKGALIGLALDLKLRKATAGAVSLDDVMRALWERHGKTGIGVEEEGIFRLVAELGGRSGASLARWLRDAVHGTDDLPLAGLLKDFGVEYTLSAASSSPTLGVKTSAGNGELKLAHVYDHGPAQAAGLSAGDILLAIDGLRVTSGNLDSLLARRSVGDKLEIHAFRRDELMRFDVELGAPREDAVKLALVNNATGKARQLRDGWLGAR